MGTFAVAGQSSFPGLRACDARILPPTQIYQQAIIANALMVKKVQQWALKTNGYFRLHDM